MGRMANSAKQSSGGRNIFLSIKENDKKRVRVLFDGAIKSPDGNISTGGTKGEPFGSWWHRIKDDPRIGRGYHEWLCVGKMRGCPLCLENDTFVASKQGVEVKINEKPYPVRKKTYVNVWGYDEGKVMVLAAGSDLFDAMVGIEEARGVDLDKLDVTIVRSGQGLRTTYQPVAGETQPFLLPDGHFLFDLEAETAVSDRSREDLDKVLSGEFDKQFVKQGAAGLPADAAGAHGIDLNVAQQVVVNFGQYAGKNLGQIAVIDMRYLAWLSQNSNDSNIAQSAAAIVNSTMAPPAHQAPPPPPPPPPVPAQPPVKAGAPPPPPPPAMPAPVMPSAAPAASPFDNLAAQAGASGKTVEQLRAECVTKASSSPVYRDPAKLKEKMMQAGGSLDLNGFSAPQLEQLLAIL